MADEDHENEHLRSTALQNVQSILRARQRAEQELIQIKEALEEETRILELLNETGAVLAGQLDLHTLARAATEAATKLSGAQIGAFFCSDGESTARLLLYALAGSGMAAFEAHVPRVLSATSFQERTIWRVADVQSDERYGQLLPSLGRANPPWEVRSYLAVPVIARTGQILGGLLLGHGHCDVFSARSERLIAGIAGQTAVAIDNARLYEQAKHAAEERARLLDAERTARTEVERISLLKDEFLATLSHELRTPLNAILGWSELLLSRATKNDPTSQRGLATIARNARAQAQLIDDLLDMSRIISGKIRLEVQRVELGPIVDSALDSVRPAAEARSITLHRELNDNGALVLGDPNRLQQVVWNLLSNAVKFTPNQGRVEVLVKRSSGQVEILVRDTGVGISSEFLPYLFERFRQADSSTTRAYGGLGLGLSIVKQLIELHGGTVRAESGGKDLGTTLYVTLPVAAASTRAATAEQTGTTRIVDAGSAPVVLAGIKVLVVEDEPDTRELLERVLANAGALVCAAASADAGIALLKSERPDVIVSDIGMPERDGYQLMRDVRSLSMHHGGKTPAIALTAFARSEDRMRALVAGYQLHLTKPVAPRELVSTIRNLVANSAHRAS